MTLYAFIMQESPVILWGLSSRERLRRVLKGAGVTDIVDDLTALPDNSSVLLLRGDYLFDDRIINYLVQTSNTLLQVSSGDTRVVAAVHISSGQALQACDAIEGKISAAELPDVKMETLATLSIPFQRRLRKLEQPFVLPITHENRLDLERYLYSWSYKGITDLVTKWAWPRPARWAVGICVRYGFRPNQVTMAGFILVILAGIFFLYGQYAWGLLAGWGMTFLDTVDGKLARVTVTSSRIGHYFDHLTDIIHPPLWYIAWGVGLQESHLIGDSGLTLDALLWLMLAGYVGGRLVEGSFQRSLGMFGIFCWKRVDSYFRLITARRNPCMILLTFGIAIGHPDLGLVWVVHWTILTSLILLVRLFMAVGTRIVSGPLKPWFLDVNLSGGDKSLAVRLFTRQTFTLPEKFQKC